MTIIVHLTEATHETLSPQGEHVHVLRHPFAGAIGPDGLASLLQAIDGLGSLDDLVVLHPDVQPEAVDRLAALLRRSQRRREVIAIGHGLGPLGSDLLVESLAVLLSDPSVDLEDAAAWCHRSEEQITDVVWTNRPVARWARLSRRDRLAARLPGRRVRIQLGPASHATVGTRGDMLTGLELSGTDVVVGGRDAADIARAMQQLGSAQARSVRIVEPGTGSPVVAEVVVSSVPVRPVPVRSVRPMSSV